METARKRTRGRPRSFNAPPDSNTIQALDRALHILKVLAGSDGMSLSELAEAARQSPATVYRVLSTYEAHGMVEFQPAQQIWFVGQEAFRIGSAFLGRIEGLTAATFCSVLMGDWPCRQASRRAKLPPSEKPTM